MDICDGKSRVLGRKQPFAAMGPQARSHNILADLARYAVKTAGNGHGRGAYAWNKHEEIQKEFHKEASNWDYLISPNAYSTEIFTRAFQFQKTMIESGYREMTFFTIKTMKKR